MKGKRVRRRQSMLAHEKGHKDLKIDNVFLKQDPIKVFVEHIIESYKALPLHAKLWFWTQVIYYRLAYYNLYQSKDRIFNFLIFMAALTFPGKQRENAIGDLLERFEEDSIRFGKSKAKILLARDVVESIYPIVKELLRSRLVKVVKMIGLHEVVKLFLR